MSWILKKSVVEIRDYADEMKDSWERRDWKGRVLHFPTDIFVEGYRRMPYTLGHVSAIGLGISLLYDVCTWLF